MHRHGKSAPGAFTSSAFTLIGRGGAAASLGATVMLAALQGQAAQLSEIGKNTLQQDTGGAVQTVCGRMVAHVGDGGTLEREEAMLFRRCGELVHSSNDLQDDGTTTLSLELSEAELQEALQNVAPEETEAMGASLTDTSQDQLASLASRLQYLRTGTTTLPVAGVYWSGEDWAGGTAGEDDFSRLGAFITGVYATGDKGETNPDNGVEDAFDFDAYGFTAGLDYRFADALVLGVGLGYIESEVEFEKDYGENETEGLSYLAYGTWYAGNFFAEGSIVYGDYDYDMFRKVSYDNNSDIGDDIEQKLVSSTEGDSLSWNLGVGYNINIENSNITFSAEATGLDADIDGYTERGGELSMQVFDQEVESLQSVLAVQAAFNFNRGFGVLVPYGSIAWHHEFEDDPRDIFARYVFDPFVEEDGHTLKMTTDGGDDDFFRLNLGANFVLTQGTQVFINYETLLGLKEVNSNAFTVGLRLAL